MTSRSRHNYLLAQGFGKRPASRRAVDYRRQLTFEPLEDRRLLANVTVTNLNNTVNGSTSSIAALISNPGADGVSLREAIAAANADSTADVINFAVTGTIQLTSSGSGHLSISRDLTIQGPGADLLTIRAFDPDANGNNDNDGTRVFDISGSGTLNVTISGLTLTNGDPAGDTDTSKGGAIHNVANLTINNCVLTGNFTNHGGTIHNEGTLTVNDSILTGNSAQDGAAIFNEGGSAVVNINRSTISNNSALNSGGGIMNRYGDVNIVDSTISGNVADIDDEAGSGKGGAISSYYSGSAINITTSTISGNSAHLYGGGIYQSSGTLTINSSTISGNAVTGNSGDERGGGIFANTSSNNLVINHSTIAFNTSPSGSQTGAGIRSGSSATLNHTLVSNNTRGASASDLSGTFNASFSLVGSTSGATVNGSTNQVNVPNANLAPLADNGGRTRTHALLAGSAALDNGDGSIASPPATDQRGVGFPRIVDGDNNGSATIDIGAYERNLPQTLVVDIATDENDFNYTPGDLSLREALIIANGNPGVADMISFHASLSGATINLTLGALTITDAVTIDGLGANLLTINGSGNGANRIFNVDNGSAGTSIAVAMAGLTLTGGNVAGDGGAIRNTETLSLTQMAISGNNATALGGGIKNESGILSIIDSTISANTAATGGGVWTDTNLTTQTTTIVGSTISGNTATTNGGGIFNADGLTIVRHSTITNNTSPAAGGGGLGTAANATTRTEVHSSIVAGNVNSDVQFVTGVTNSFQSNGYNIVGSGNANGEFVEVGDQRNVANPSLGALADNGGPTLTHAPQLGSLAINAGDPNAQAGVGTVPTFDQRGTGFDRVLESRIDAGAIEATPPPPPEIAVTGNGQEIADGDTMPGTSDDTDFGSTPHGGATVSHTFTVRNDGTGTLTLGAVSVPDGFTVTDPLVTSLAGGASDTLTVRLDTTKAGTKTGDVSFTTNDSDETTFNFSITGVVTTSIPELPGDYNRDGSVDAADYVMWRKTLSMTVPQYEGADGDGDTTIGNGDYSVWTENYGESTPGSGGGGISESLAEPGDDDTHNHRALLDASTVPAREFAQGAVRGTPAAPGSAPVAKTSDLLNVLDSLFGESDDQYSDSDSMPAGEAESSAQDEVFDQFGGGSAFEMLSI